MGGRVRGEGVDRVVVAERDEGGTKIEYREMMEGRYMGDQKVMRGAQSEMEGSREKEK